MEKSRATRECRENAIQVLANFFKIGYTVADGYLSTLSSSQEAEQMLGVCEDIIENLCFVIESVQA